PSRHTHRAPAIHRGDGADPAQDPQDDRRQERQPRSHHHPQGRSATGGGYEEMTKERKTQIVTVVVLAAAFGVVLAQKTGWKFSDVKMADIVQSSAPRAEPSPQDAIYAMLDAARVGDVKTYLAAYTGQMDAALKQSLAETT